MSCSAFSRIASASCWARVRTPLAICSASSARLVEHLAHARLGVGQLRVVLRQRLLGLERAASASAMSLRMRCSRALSPASTFFHAVR